MIIFSSQDGCYYGTATEKAAAAGDVLKAQPTTKFYEYETGKLYVTDGTVWHIVGVAD